MNKIKEFFSGLVGAVVLVLTGAVALLVYYLNGKQREINSLKAKIDLVETQKQADLLEVEIKERMANKDVLAKEILELKDSLSSLEQKRKQLAEQEKNKSDKDIEDYWEGK